MRCIIKYFVFSTVVGLSYSVKWEDPKKAARLSADRVPEAYGDRFCRDEDYSTGRQYVGTLSSDNVCRIILDNEIHEAPYYKVLVLSPKESSYSWEWASLRNLRPPPSAVPCDDDDDQVAKDDCYLGTSVSGDGICDESVGKVNLATKQVSFPDPYVGQDIQKCPFIGFLTVE